MYYNNSLFTVSNFQRKSDNKISFKMDMIYNLERTGTVTPAIPWLLPASEQPAKDIETLFIAQMKKRR
jgi:hypothetical protein